jgi:hypothetical protein
MALSLPLNSDVRVILNAIADGLLPLHSWYAARTGKNCEDCRPSRLGVVEFIENLVRQWTPANPGRRWHERVKRLETDPLLVCPLDDPASWRAARGLAAIPEFKVAKSDNMDVDRAQLYERYLPPLTICVKARLPNSPPWLDAELERLGQELLVNECPHWPAAAGKSDFFTHQLLIDVAGALMSMQRIASPRPFALLEALKHHRRVGNRFDSNYAADVVAAFKRELDRPIP